MAWHKFQYYSKLDTGLSISDVHQT